MRVIHLSILFGPLALAAGCKDKAPPAYEGDSGSATVERPKKPMQFESKDERYKVVVFDKEKPERKIEGILKEEGYGITLFKFPKGTKWSANGKQGTVDNEVFDAFDLGDVTERMGGLELEDKLLGLRWDCGIEIAIDTPDGFAGKTTLPPVVVATTLPKILARVVQGPLVFKDEPPDDTAKRNIVAVFPGTSLKVVGDKTALNQIDKIAVIERLPDPKGTQSCSYTARTVTMNLLETESVLYDRRTGKELARRRFPPRRVCPELVALDAKQTKIGSEMPRDQITAYLKVELAKK